MRIGFITSSENKLQELALTLGANHEVDRLDVDLPEIQSLNPKEIIEEKLKVAQTLFPNETIVVEDTSFEIDALDGLPGTFIKFFIKRVGLQKIHTMARGVQPDGDLTARARTVIGVSHGDKTHFLEGVVDGTLVPEGGDGWGFDKIFIPTGYDKRMGSLGIEIKSQISHRALAVIALRKYLDSLN
jgi:inosine triphosphate pyrophosphatase